MRRFSKESLKRYVERESISWMKVLFPAYVASLIAPLYYFFDLFSNFALQYAIGGIVLGSSLLYFRRRYWAALAFAIAILSVIETRVHLQEPFRLRAPGGTPDFSITSFNHNVGQPHFDRLIDYLSTTSNQPDMILLIEASEKTATAGAKLASLYPYQIHEHRKTRFGMVVLSKLPFEQKEKIIINGPEISTYAMRLSVRPDTMRDPMVVYAAHALPPISPRYDLQRNYELMTLARRLREDAAPNKIMIGDWNITPFAPAFGDLLKLSGMNFQSYGFMLNPTWPSFLFFSFLQIPIDHVIFSDNLIQTEKSTGPALMSDHYMLKASFSEKIGASHTGPVAVKN